MERWATLREALLREGEIFSTADEEGEGGTRQQQQQQQQQEGEGQEGSAERRRRRRECVLAASVTAEVLETAILGVGCVERHVVRRALPLISGQSLVGAITDRPLLLSLAASASAASGDGGGGGGLVDHVAALVQHFVRRPGEALPGEGDGVQSKRRQKGGPPKTPKPINHSVLSSPIVLKAATEFHPKTNAVVSFPRRTPSFEKLLLTLVCLATLYLFRSSASSKR